MMISLQEPLVAELMREIGNLAFDSLVSEAALDCVRESAIRSHHLCMIAERLRQVLDEQGYVQIRGLPVLSSPRHFVALGTLLGRVYIDPATRSALVPAHVKAGETLMGNQLRALPLHTDYSMMDLPPRLTMSYCIRADSLAGFGAVFLSDIESSCFGVESDPRIQRFLNLLFPFASRNAGDDVDVIERPILIIGDSNNAGFLVRYHRSRIRQGFRYRGQVPTSEQSSTMLEFEDWAQRGQQTIELLSGDITVIDNHRMLHGRSPCSIELDNNGTSVGRQMMFLFVH